MNSVDPGISDLLAAQLSNRIEQETALSFNGDKRRDLRNALPRMARAAGFPDVEACANWLLSGSWTKSRTDLCASHLTIGETYFFREPRAFELVCDTAQQKFHQRTGPLRVWSAGCCTGEEPYSIAMALKERFPALDSRQVSILATDLSPGHLQIGQAGIYRQWSMRSTSKEVERRYFCKSRSGEFQLHQSIKSMVIFDQLNLASDSYPSVTNATHGMDIIFCRNVLMYFSRAQALAVIARLRNCLVEGGWLVVSPTEASSELYEGFTPRYLPDAIHFQKQSRPATANPADATATKGRRPALSKALGTEGARTWAERPLRAAKPVTRLDQKSGTAVLSDFQEAALLAMESGDNEAAIRSLRKELYLRPDAVLAYYWLGVAHLDQRQPQAAIRQFRTVTNLISRLPDHATVPGAEQFTAAYLREAVAVFVKKAEAVNAEAA